MHKSSELGFVIDGSHLSKLKYFNLDGLETQTVFVWVESREDKRFWRSLLKDNNNYKFEIKLPDQFLSVDGKAATGCKRLMAMLDRKEVTLSKHNIFCIDDDGSFLSSFCNEYEDKINKKHIYTTKIFSIDNAFLVPMHVDRVLANISACELNKLVLKPSDLIEALSCSSHDTVALLSYANVITPQAAETLRNGLHSAIQRLKLIDFEVPLAESAVYQEYLGTLNSLNESIKTNFINAGFEGKFEAYESKLLSIGLNRSNAFLFIRGHDVFDMIISVADRMSKHLKRQEEVRIKGIYQNPGDVVKALKNEWAEFASTLKQCFYYTSLEVEFLADTVTELSEQYS
ncbi:DUF4435 domain-containing protein [Pseudomonas fluorescens]|uniref:DUF4435 domain-containing protein n=1 Tax=Pseudomonas fluorescens TaxID=294 RepID=UPI00324C1158